MMKRFLSIIGGTVGALLAASAFTWAQNSGSFPSGSGGGGSPGGSTTQLQYNNAGAFGGVSGWTTNGTTAVTNLQAPAANTSTDGLILSDTTAASSANQQFSPRIRLTAQGWKTTATAASQATDWIVENQPVQGTANPSSNLVISNSINAGAYANLFQLTSAGALSINANTSSATFVIDASNSWETYFKVSGSIAAFLANNGEFAATFFSVGSPVSSSTLITQGAAGVGTLQFGAADAAAPVAQTLQVQSVVAGTTDTAGPDWSLVASKPTGLGAGGNIVEKTGVSAKSTGTGQGATVDRDIIVAKGKVLTSAAAFSMFDVALPTLTMAGGVIEATIVCTDGTNVQSFTQTVTYSAVNKGGVYTTSITPSTGDKSVSTGTLTTSWTIVSGTNLVSIKVTPTTSLTPSTNSFLLYYRVRNNSEQSTTIH